MTPYEFAQRHFYNFKIRGNEIVPEYCPYCHGGNHNDKYTFALNMDNLTFNCKRGSCGVAGTFSKLCADFNETPDKRNYELTRTPQRKYREPKTEVKPATTEVEKYLMSRGFSKKTWEHRGVGEDGKGNIVFPYYENGKLVMVKFRPGRKLKKGEKKGWREEGGKPVFWGMDLCTPDKPLVIVEGEMDALALDECGIPNVVSVPSGNEDLTCINLCWDWLQKFNKIIIWVDADEAGQKLQRNLINRLGVWRCWVVNGTRKDANEVLYFDGKEKIIELFNNAVEVPINGLIRLAEVQSFDFSKCTRIFSSITGLNKVTGGFLMGQCSVWTGKRSNGKSSILGQVLLDAVDQGFSVCAYSGELPAPNFKYWINLQAAGKENVDIFTDKKTQKLIPTVKPDVEKAITAWYYDKFFLYDTFDATTEQGIFEVFEYAAKRYDCKVFLVDNLMTIIPTLKGSEDYWRKQSDFILNISAFARKFDAHVHVVAHPRKTNNNNLESDDVGGIGDITNRVDNVFVVRRLYDEEKNEKQCDTIITVRKNRMFGLQNLDICLNFDEICKRFYMASEPEATKQYGWTKYLNSTEEDLPWEE